MRSPFARGPQGARSGKAKPRLPQSRDQGLSAEQERALEFDDLLELLAATNAKRAARGKAPLSTSDVEMRLWVEEQEIRRSGPAEAPHPDDDWG